MNLVKEKNYIKPLGLLVNMTSKKPQTYELNFVHAELGAEFSLLPLINGYLPEEGVDVSKFKKIHEAEITGCIIKLDEFTEIRIEGLKTKIAPTYYNVLCNGFVPLGNDEEAPNTTGRVILINNDDKFAYIIYKYRNQWNSIIINSSMYYDADIIGRLIKKHYFIKLEFEKNT